MSQYLVVCEWDNLEESEVFDSKEAAIKEATEKYKTMEYDKIVVVKVIREFTPQSDKLEGCDYFSCGVLASCETCQSDYGMTEKQLEENPPEGEPFIGHNCDGCDSSLQRDDIYDCHCRDKDNNIIHLNLCSDCVVKYCS